MKDLEKHIRENRAGLDTEKVPGSSWKVIEQRTGLKKKAAWADYLKIAAGISIGLLIGLLLYQQDTNIEHLYSLGDIAPEYARVEDEYQETVEELYQKIDFQNLDSAEYQWLLEEIDYIDELNVELRKDIDSNVNSEKLVKSLIDHYEKKIRLLERLELEINREKYEEDRTAVL